MTLEFGTAGIRETMGNAEDQLNVQNVKKFALAIANIEKYQKIVIGYDTRHHSKEFAQTIAEVLTNQKFNKTVFISNNYTQTPLLSYAVKYYEADCGIMITASHNPKNYNGIKVYDKNGVQLLPEETIKIKNNMNDNSIIYQQLTNQKNTLHYILDDCIRSYINQSSQIANNVLRESRHNIMLTSFHGTSRPILTRLLENLNFNQFIWDEQTSNPDPNFSHIQTANPEKENAFDQFIQKAINLNCSLIIGTDPDSDRLGLVELYKDGSYRFFTANEIAMILLYLRANDVQSKSTIITSHVTSESFKELCQRLNLNLIQTSVGFKFIADEIQYIKDDFLFAYEESHGFLFDSFVGDKDAIQCIPMIIQYKTDLERVNRTFYDLLFMIKGSLDDYKDQTLSIDVNQDKIDEVMNHLETYHKANICQLTIQKYIIDHKNNYVEIITDKGHIIVRPSGTEPKIKIYFSLCVDDLNQCINQFLEFLNLE